MVVPGLRKEMPALPVPNLRSNPAHNMMEPLCCTINTQNFSSNLLLPGGLLTPLGP